MIMCDVSTGQDSSVSRASDFGPRGWEFEYTSCPGNDLGQVTSVVCLTVPRCKNSTWQMWRGHEQ